MQLSINRLSGKTMNCTVDGILGQPASPTLTPSLVTGVQQEMMNGTAITAGI